MLIVSASSRGGPTTSSSAGQVGAQIRDRLFWCGAAAKRPHPGTEQSGGAPDAVLILLNHVEDVKDLTHAHGMARHDVTGRHGRGLRRSPRTYPRSPVGDTFEPEAGLHGSWQRFERGWREAVSGQVTHGNGPTSRRI